MIIFLHGEDNFRIHERVGILRNGFVTKYDSTGLSIKELYGSSLTVDEIRSSLLTVGSFTEKRFVVIHDALDMKAAQVDVLLKTLDAIDEDTVLVCTAGALPKKSSDLQKRLLEADRVEEYGLLQDGQLRNWITQRVTDGKATISKEALAYLMQAVGNDLWTMHHAIDQLIYYTQSHDDGISLEATELFVPSAIDDNIFHFTDALSERQTQRALTLLHDQFSSGANAFYVMSMIARQIRILIQVKETDKPNGVHPYVVKKAKVHAQRFALEDLHKLHTKLVNIDRDLKSSVVNPKLLLDQFVIEATK